MIYNGFVRKNTTDDFHVYRIAWTKDMVVMYIDDLETYRTVDPQKIPKEPMYITLVSGQNFASSMGIYGGHLPPVKLAMEVAWIKYRALQTA